MLTTILPQEMQALEKQWMQETGVPGILLMEYAARGAAEALKELLPSLGRVLFLCGPGNNGGDGYAAARIWQELGGESLIWELTEAAKGDALTNRTLAKLMNIPIHTLKDAPETLPEVAGIADALFGTGLSRAVEGTAAAVIRLVNASGLPVLAVDIPSGLDGTAGRPLGETVRADVTVTFHRPKQGLVMEEAAPWVGRLKVCPILIPEAYGEVAGLRILEEKDLPGIFPARPVNAHKGMLGRLVILAGSRGMAGAAALCARAAIRSGAGLTTLLCRAETLPVLQTLVPGATCRVLEETSPEEGKKLLQAADAAIIGPGLGQEELLQPWLRLFREADCPVVWDADALNLLSGHPELMPLKENAVITPHPGEAARLAGREPDRSAMLRRLREKCGCHVLLKGCRTLMTDGSRTAVNLCGSPALAKGGSGDTLAGILGALLCRKTAAEKRGETAPDTLTVLQAACLKHGLAGQRLARRLGEDALLPEELAEGLTENP